MARDVAEQSGVQGQPGVQMSLTPVHVAREGALGVGRIGLAGVEALEDFRIRGSGVLGQSRCGHEEDRQSDARERSG